MISNFLMKLMRKSWNMMAIEHLSLWTTAIDDILMWKEEVLKEIVDFFFSLQVNHRNWSCQLK